MRGMVQGEQGLLPTSAVDFVVSHDRMLWGQSCPQEKFEHKKVNVLPQATFLNQINPVNEEIFFFLP